MSGKGLCPECTKNSETFTGRKKPIQLWKKWQNIQIDIFVERWKIGTWEDTQYH